MKLVTEIKGLFLVGIEGHRKEDPTEEKCGQEADQEIDQSTLKRFGDQFINIGIKPVQKSREGEPLTGFFRGMIVIFHGGNLLANSLI